MYQQGHVLQRMAGWILLMNHFLQCVILSVNVSVLHGAVVWMKFVVHDQQLVQCRCGYRSMKVSTRWVVAICPTHLKNALQLTAVKEIICAADECLVKDCVCSTARFNAHQAFSKFGACFCANELSALQSRAL